MESLNKHEFFLQGCKMKLIKNSAICFPQGLMAVLFFLITLSNAHSYTFTDDFKKGFYWESFPIKMTRFAVDQTDAYYLQALVDQSVDEWESAIGQDIWSVSPVERSDQVSGNFIKWSENFGEETGYDPSRTLAITIRYNKGTFFEKTVIILNGKMATLRQNSMGNLKTTLLHEIGHTIGLDHSEMRGALMYASLGQTSFLTSDDREGALAAIGEHLKRQETGYISPYSTSEEKGMACGSVIDIAKSGGSGGGGSNFIGSLLFGVLSALILTRTKKRKKTNFIND